MLVRGHADTRLARLDDGSSGLDALLVAYAGLHRLGQTPRGTDPRPAAVAAGLQRRHGRRRIPHPHTTVRDLLASVTHSPTVTRSHGHRARRRTGHPRGIRRGVRSGRPHRPPDPRHGAGAPGRRGGPPRR
ncbi:hypothetical protein AB0A70_07980 [Streptomyces morookaense]|uniref:hypothetical protein n=1 Tax=Streptomyces morookaense TaxID=1970 RepID=UPI0033CCA31E